MKLIEECSGVGEIACEGEVFGNVRYAISRYQGLARSGLPIPGLHRIEGALEIGGLPEPLRRVGKSYALTLDDGRVIRVTLAGEDGRVLTEGHGPSRCSCC
jgi:hypothetical protein